ncbi:MAG: sugar ABC transporter permease [Lachnospiraceae bacterium]|nr:sugar ABC transporter permease [Lachnospiraceae bacterium]
MSKKTPGKKVLPAERKGLSRFFYNVVRHKWLLLMLLPSLIYIILFAYLPLSGLVLAFKKFNYRDGVYFSPWNGLNNFRFLIISKKLWPLTRNTLLYNFAFIVVGLFCQVSLAILINEIRIKSYKKVTQSMIMLPYFISWVVVSAMFTAFFGYEQGIISTSIRSIGGTPLNLTQEKRVWPFVLVFMHVWKGVGYGTVVYMAAITGIDQEIYEAAEVDGANVWQRIFYITIPSLRPTMMTMFLLALGNVFRGDFGMFYQLVGNNAKILEIADVLDLFIYRILISNNDIGMSSAAGFYQSILCFVTIVTVNKVIKMANPDYALF